MGRGTRWIARELAVSAAAPVTNVIADGAEYAILGIDQARIAWRGGRGLHRAYADERGSTPSHAVLGGEFSHGAGDRTNALASIGSDFLALGRDLAAADACTEWIATDVAPVFSAWATFVTRMADSPLASYVTQWRVFEAWWQRVVDLREAARARGIVLASPEPQPLPKTIWQRGADGTGSTFDAWMSLGRKGFFAALALTGAIGLYVTVKNVRRDVRALVAGGE